jgi:beta-glucosidase
MKRLHVSTYRMGIEWSRLQSRAYAPLNADELARYADQLERLNSAGIVPMVVLHHFSNPNWIIGNGGWVNSDIGALRDKVRIWNTFNEPDTYACCGYVISQFPPLKRCRLRAYRRIIRHMADAHHRICQLIRETASPLGPVEVGFSKNWTWFQAYDRRWVWDALAARVAHRQFNSFVVRQFLGGDGLRRPTFLGLNY